MNATLPKILMCVFGSWLMLVPGPVRAGGGKGDGRRILAPAGSPVRTFLNINSISTVIKNTGVLDIDQQESNSGLVFPKGSGKTAVFQSGFLWGGKVSGETRVGGSAYREGLQPGKILGPGIAESRNLPKNRIYRVRPDERPGAEVNADLSSEMADEGLSEADIRTQYETDWMEWPAGDGAPFTDVDQNNMYDPAVDIPGVPGAGQTVWYVANDLDSNLTVFLYGSRSLGMEVQVTIWAYAGDGALAQSFFRKYLFINKSNTPFDSMFVSAWSDPDVGVSTNDFAGCDTSLGLGYCYNANDTDATYDPLPPPAVGFAFLRGPLVDSPGDTGVAQGRRIPGKKNLGMTAFYYFTRGDAVVTDPTQGSYDGTLQFYNFFQGRVGRTGVLFTDPMSFQATPFALAGDPVSSQGWVDGELVPAGDRRIGLASGPFSMAAGDTQEVVVAEIMAGATPGLDRLSAVTVLRMFTLELGEFFDTTFVITDVRDGSGEMPGAFTIRQNYPNPFNPRTVISYDVPRSSPVRLAVYNLLGEEVALLVDEVQGPGMKTLEWDADGMPGGVYFYRLTAGSFTGTGKMLLIR